MPVIYRYIKLALKISMPRLDHLFSGDEASSRRVEKKKESLEKGKKRVMEPKTSGSFWGKGPDGPAACRAGWGEG